MILKRIILDREAEWNNLKTIRINKLIIIDNILYSLQLKYSSLIVSLIFLLKHSNFILFFMRYDIPIYNETNDITVIKKENTLMETLSKELNDHTLIIDAIMIYIP